MAMANKGLVIALLFSLLVLVAIPRNSSAQEGGWIVQTSGAGSLDVMLEQNWTDDGKVKFDISFFHPNTTRLHEHQDYDVLILQGDQQVFSAAGAINQPLIHNVEGTVSVPLQPIQLPNGEYTIEVHVLGLGFPPLPITPEVATFPITVVPEFPPALAGVIAATVVSTIVLTRRFKLF
jgi:hypothetical protein